jgi:excisionase family DNA binding protein
MRASNGEQWMTVEEVAEELRIPRRQVYKLIHGSELPAHRIGKRTIRVNRAELYAWLEDRKNTPKGG